MTNMISVANFARSPLRNRVRLQLRAEVSEVWALMGDLARFPEYSSGLARVDVEKDARGAPTAYVCHFKPQEEGGEGIRHREILRWWEPNRGYGSVAEEPNPLGQTDTLSLMTLEAAGQGTRMTYDMHYDLVDPATLDMNRTAIDQALVDIADNLIRHFGGEMVEHYVER